MLDIESWGGQIRGDRSAGINAAYVRNPPYPGRVAHQYTDGSGYGGGLPEGAPPFGRCDMNSADGYTAEEFARACGVSATDSVPREVSLYRIRPNSFFE